MLMFIMRKSSSNSLSFSTPSARTTMIPFHMRKWIKIKPAIRITFIPAKMHNIQPAFTRRGLNTAISAIAGSYMKYISYTVKDGTITTRARNNAITAIENRMGRFMLVNNGDYDPMSCLSIYRQKDAIEKAFEMLKTDLDLFPLRARKPSTVRGTIFVLFIALILRSMIVRAMNLSGLTKKYSIERMFLELEKLQIIKKDDGSFEELERTKKQRDILTALEKISWG